MHPGRAPAEGAAAARVKVTVIGDLEGEEEAFLGERWPE